MLAVSDAQSKEEEEDEEEKISDEFKNLKTSTYSKILKTGFVFWSDVMVGMSDSLLGPSLLDLQALLKSNLDGMTYIVLVTGLGDFVGALLAGFIARIWHIHFRLSSAVLVGAVSIAISAAVPNYYFVLVMFAVQGVLRGIVFCFATEACNRIWTKNKGIAFQSLSLGPALGQMLSPLIVKPFLCLPSAAEEEQGVNNEILLSNFSNAIDSVNVRLDERYTNMTNVSGTHALSCLPEDVRLSYSYIILGVLILPASVAFFVYWRIGEKTVEKIDESSSNISVDSRFDSRLKIVFVVVFFIFYFPLLGSLVSYSTYLTEFSVRGPLRLEKQTGVTLTSLFWISSVSGRFVSIFVLKVVNIEKLMITSMAGLFIFSTVLVTCVSYSQTVLWVCTCAGGLFVGPFSGGGYSWITSKMRLSSRVISLSGASMALGAMILPFVSGQVFDNAGPMAFIYFTYSLYIILFILFISLVILARKLKPLTVTRAENILTPEGSI